MVMLVVVPVGLSQRESPLLKCTVARQLYRLRQRTVGNAAAQPA